MKVQIFALGASSKYILVLNGTSLQYLAGVKGVITASSETSVKNIMHDSAIGALPIFGLSREF